MTPSADGGELIPRAAGDDVIVRVVFRQASFERLTSTADGRSVPVDAGLIGLVPDAPDVDGEAVWTFVVWSGEPTWSAAGELIPGNLASAAAARIAERREYQRQAREQIGGELSDLDEGRCRECGCSDSLACPDGCYWVEADLCSECAADLEGTAATRGEGAVSYIDPEAQDLRAAAIVAEVYLRLEAAKLYGFVTGGPEINVERCEQIIKQARAAGHDWSEFEVQEAITDVLAHETAATRGEGQ